MLKSNILKKLGLKHENLSDSDIELVFNIFIKKIISALKDNKNVELPNDEICLNSQNVSDKIIKFLNTQ